MGKIKLFGVQQNNLKNIDVEIPLNSFTVVCGPSGSGKSSLAFETLYAEGQRRYIEGMSNYAKQFLSKLPKPNVELIENIPPAIAIEQKNSVKNSRSTVGTHTEILDYLRLLFEKIGIAHCPKHKTPLKSHNITHATDLCLKHFSNKKGYLLAPIYKKHRVFKGKKLLSQLLQDGFLRIYLPPKKTQVHLIKKTKTSFPVISVEMGEVIDLQSPSILKKGLPNENFYIVIDRLLFNSDDENKQRISDSIEQSYQTSLKFNSSEIKGRCHFLTTQGELLKTSQTSSCPICHTTSQPITASFFSFNNPLGACPSCKGFGNTLDLCKNKIIPRPHLSIKEGAIIPFSMPSAKKDLKRLLKFCEKHKINTDHSWESLSEKHQGMIWNGTKDFYGIKGLFEYLETKKYKMYVRVFLSRFKSPSICSVCQGTRLKKDSQSVLIKNKNISQFSTLTIKDLHSFFLNLTLSKKENNASHEIIRQIKKRLKFLLDVGVYYLTFDRETKTLSGGEFQRLNLAKQLGMGLSQSLYVLDEPTIGLHPRDNKRLIQILQELHKLGNTLVVVEHDQSVIENASYLIEMGPGSGKNGGEIIFSGKLEQFYKSTRSKTLPFLQKKNPPPLSCSKMSKPFNTNKHSAFLQLKGCQGNNLKNIHLKLPLHCFVTITGVSGSGKSTLITQTLYPALAKKIMGEPSTGHSYKSLSGEESLQNALLIDQSSISKTARSNPVSYLKVFDSIRKVFSDTKEAKNRNYTPGTFSLNVDGGRCPLCKGLGFEEVDMIFMDNISIPCEVCDGVKYRKDILEIKWGGKNIHDVLNITIDEAIEFFISLPHIRKPLSILKDVGLGYLKLGQSMNSLSGGEAQRLKIAKELSQNRQKATLYIMDEPTTGLHFQEIWQLIHVIDKLIASGSSVVLIEHNMDIINSSDYIIDLGPEAGQDGGFIVAQGSVSEITQCPQSLTGQYLKIHQKGYKQAKVI